MVPPSGRPWFPAAVLLLAVALVVGPLGPHAASWLGPSSAGSAATAGTTTTVEATSCYTGLPAYEPTIGATSNGTLFMQASFEETGTGQHVHRSQGIVRSWSGCGTWTDVTPRVATPAGPVGTPPTPSLDPIVHVDADADRVFNLDMQGLQCNWLAYSDDDGRTWQHNPLACGQPAGWLDHPSLFTGPPRVDADRTLLAATGYPNVVYLCVNRVADAACARSLDGGRTFGAFRPLVFTGYDPGRVDVDPTDPIGTALSGFCGAIHGHGTTGPDGRIYLGRAHCAVPTVATSGDDGLTWSRSTVAPDGRAHNHDVEVAVDEAGTVYALWTNATDRLPRLSASTDHGRTWTDPVPVAPSRVNVTSFATIAAGGPGGIAVVYYGTHEQMRDDGDVPRGAPWNGYIAVATDADTGDPTFRTAQVNPDDDPIARGACDSHDRCTPHDPHETFLTGFSPPSPGDFIDVVIDGDGRPWGAFVDVCNGTCEGTVPRAKEGHRGFAGTLVEGPALR